MGTWKGYEYTCIVCGRKDTTHYKNKKYCSHTCQGINRQATPLLKKCKNCNSSFNARELHRGIKRALNKIYCSFNRY